MGGWRRLSGWRKLNSQLKSQTLTTSLRAAKTPKGQEKEPAKALQLPQAMSEQSITDE